MSAQTELREETLAAIYAAHDAWNWESGERPVWVMSREWFYDIRRMVELDPARFVNAPWAMLGILIEIREDAGFPKLQST